MKRTATRASTANGTDIMNRSAVAAPYAFSTAVRACSGSSATFGTALLPPDEVPPGSSVLIRPEPPGGLRYTLGGMTAAITADLAPKGVLRASINLGNPVLAQGSPQEPAGITVDLAREIATRLGVPVEFLCFDAARKSFEAMVNGQADLCFLAIDPAREAEVAFSAPYVVIEGVYAVPRDSALATVADVDRAGVRIGVKQGSAYDLFLTRTLEQATVVRGEEGVEVFRAEGLEAAAGIRQPIAKFVAANPDVRMIEERFMQIQQAVGTTKDRQPETVEFLRDVVEELKASGFVAESLQRANQSDAEVAPLSA
jgi:polar amino acid transport system substrate-binding protein